jgi:hypothetical protein
MFDFGHFLCARLNRVRLTLLSRARKQPIPTSAPLLPQRAAWGRAVRDRSKKFKVAREDLEAALEQFREIAADLSDKRRSSIHDRTHAKDTVASATPDHHLLFFSNNL